MERVQAAELIAPAPAIVGPGLIAEAEQCLKIVFLPIPDHRQRFGFRFLLGKQSLLNDFADVSACQGDASLEAPLDLRDVLSLEIPEVTEHALEVRLRSDEHPRTPTTYRSERLGHRL